MIIMYTSVLLALSVIGPVYSLLTTEIVITNLSQPLSNLLFHDDKLYVGGRNNIYVLNKEDLGVLDEVSTCINSVQNCKNLNSLLLIKDVGDKYLINCGTGDNGICEARNLMNINDVNITKDTKLVSSDIKRPVQGIITQDGNLLLAVTFGDGIPTSGSGSYEYAISKRDVQTFIVAGSVNDGSSSHLILQPISDFIIYYKSTFNSGDFSYFTTIQKESSHENIYISKLVRLCQTEFASYVDMPINCQSDGVAYKMLQTAVLAITKSGAVFVGAFTRGNNPENPESESVICVEKLTSLDEDLNESLRTFVTSNKTDKVDPTRYLEDKRPNSIEEKDYRIEDHICGDYDYKYAIGKEKHNLTASYKINEESGYVSTLHATKLDGYDVVLAGTSKGHIYQFNLENEFENFSLTMFDNQTIDDEGSEIRGIKEDGNFTLYVMSSSKLFKLKSTRCSEFKTCQDTMAKRNPHCGWCVFEDRASRKDLCPTKNRVEHWIHSYQKCIELNTSINVISVGSTGKMVTVTAIYFARRPENAHFTCKFSKGQTVIEISGAQQINNNIFSCSIPSVKVHTEATLELIVNGNVSLASTPFLFYSCDHYKSCGKCVGKDNANCTWDITNIKCTEPGSAGSIHVDDVGQCPLLNDNTGKNFLATGVKVQVTLNASNVPNTSSSSLKLWCFLPRVDGTLKDEYSPIKHFDNSTLACDLIITLTASSKGMEVPIFIKYGNTEEFSANLTAFEDGFDNKVTVYSCSGLGKDCSHCKVLKDHYNCIWKNDGCHYNSNSSENDKCPAPKIEKIQPRDGPRDGGTKLTIYGTELGTERSDIKNVTIDGVICNVTDITNDTSSVYFAKSVPISIFCTTGKGTKDTIADVLVKVNEKVSTKTKQFSYKTASLTDMKPDYGPVSGGTKLTFYGNNLGIGNRKVRIVLGKSSECIKAKVIPEVGLDIGINDISENFTIQCEIKKNTTLSKLNDFSRISLTGSTGQVEFSKTFTFLPDPTIDDIYPKKGTISGGTGVTLTGKNFTNSHNGKIEGIYKGEPLYSPCTILSGTQMVCKAPEAPKSMKAKIMNMINSSRRKRSDCSDCIKVEVTVYLDGFSNDFTLTYYRDPYLSRFDDKDNVRLFDSENQQLTIKGKYINLVAKESDINVTIGLEICSVFELREDSITCLAPKDQPIIGRQGINHPEVNVTIGNYHERVGFIEYIIKVEILIYIITGVAGGLLAIIVLGIGVGIYKYKKVGKKARAYEKNLSDMEMEIKRVAREEFLDMHTTMSSVNKNLVEQGFPYHSYQQFACNVMFSVDYLWTEPVMTDDERLKANRGMEQLESLIYNKFFLVSVISTMEKEKRFFVREKSNLAGNLCAVLMGRMDYLDEILKLLMNDLVSDTPQRKHKTLFRRCESITEKLLSNWLSLCLYPHIKSHSGSPLYLLHMATQKTMESGPIDAVTGDAKYTLSEEKLLKKWSSSMEEDHDNKDLKFEAKTLTLNVVVDNGDEIFKCKVLDCDTISQVKNKCLNQIYVNFPASRLPVGANDLALEWHEGFGGTLKLRDEDNTSKREGKWLRLNTLAHYNVKDESNMALIDPHSPDVDNQEDYVNLAHINMEGVCDGSIDSSQPLTLHDEQISHEYENWHLVKKEEESSKQGKGAIAELYLNRLFTTKQSLMEYMRPLIDIILDHDKCPPPTKFLYDYLDELGDKYKVDADTVHAWKSHSYAIRVWASLMKMPNLLFDVSIPAFMEANLGIISQMFIESFSLGAQKFTKDTPPEKLIFHHETNHYRDRVKEFYKNVKVDQEDSDAFRQYMAEVNRLQQGTEFNKVSALYRLYKQLKPYFEDILESLATSKEASNLQLDRKLEQVMAIMEEDE